MPADTSRATTPMGATAPVRGRRWVERGVSASASTSQAQHDAATGAGIAAAIP